MNTKSRVEVNKGQILIWRLRKTVNRIKMIALKVTCVNGTQPRMTSASEDQYQDDKHVFECMVLNETCTAKDVDEMNDNAIQLAVY